MHSPESNLGFRSRAAADGDAPRLWGHDPVELHDHFWRQIGVEVVRPGSRPDATGIGPGQGVDTMSAADATVRGRRAGTPRAYLLLGLDELAAFAPGAAFRRLTGVRRRSVLVELMDPAAPGYREQIDADERDALVSIRRQYDPPRPLGSVLLTRDRRLAEWWRRNVHPARHPRAATAVDRALARRRHQPLHGTARGVLEEGTDRGGTVRWFETMMRLDDALAATVPHVAPREPGVWVHESARIGPHVSLAGPLWIGEHVVLEGNASLVGPRMLLDDSPRIGGLPGRRPVGAPFDGGTPEPDRTRAMPAPASAAENAAGLLGRVRERLIGGRDGGRDGGTSRRGGASSFIETRRLVPAAVRLSPRSIEVRPEPRSIRVFNILVSAGALLAVLPLFPVIMLAILVEDGRPFFFGHVRQTRGGRNFTCWKFRTMCRDAERMKSQLTGENVCDGPQFHIADDPRLLRIGRLLRRFHLDELPQLWHVLRGDMNLVGPRPSPDDENQYCPAWRDARLSVKPGLTGLWQIRRTRAPMADFQEWIRWDLEYVQRRSWSLDLWIIWRTAVSLVSGRGVPQQLPPVGGPAALATMTGFRRPTGRPDADAATVTAPGDAPVASGTRVPRGLGIWTATADARANAEAVDRAIREERDRTIARTTSPTPDAPATSADGVDAAAGMDAGVVDAPRPEADGATTRGTDAPAAGFDGGEVEAKPRQPVHDADAVGDRDVEAKPQAKGLPRPAEESASESPVEPAPPTISGDEGRDPEPPVGGDLRAA
jgi:lipopolysaccharide/colanic/teichoic acid biosynthesis glycosyltransferase